TIITVTLYALGLVGMAGGWLIPAHAWSLVFRRCVRRPLPSRPVGGVLAIVAFLPIVFSLLLAAPTLPRVFRSPSAAVCGPHRATGLLLTARFGAAVLVTEIVWQIAGLLLARIQDREA